MTRIRIEVESRQTEEFNIDALRVLQFRDRSCVLVESELCEEILREAHCSLYTSKRYQDL